MATRVNGGVRWQHVSIAAAVVSLIAARALVRRGRPGGALVGPALVAASLPVLASEARRERDPGLFWLLLSAEVLKLGGAIVRHEVGYRAYRGGDAEAYHQAGIRVAECFRKGDLRAGLDSYTGTNFIRLATGAVYTVLGPTRIGGFFVYSWLGFWGLFSFRRAFVLAVPEGSSKTYDRLLFFSPSLLYWPSGIGKDAWMLLSLGLGANGVARVLSTEQRRGLGLAASGMSLASLVRPHVAGAMGVSLAGAHLLRGPRPRVVPLAAFVGLLVGWAARYLRRFQIDTRAGWRAVLDRVVARTSRGGSAFMPSAARTPAQASLAAGTVLFRPHALETHNRRADVAAVEDALLLLLSLNRLRWAAAAVRSSRRQPYVAFALACTALLVGAFSSIANFGILARQRAQVLPFYFVLLSIPPRRGRRAPFRTRS